MREIKLQELKAKSPTELLAFADEQEVEGASTLRKQELMFAILKQLAANEIEIIGEGVRRGAAGRVWFPSLGRCQLSCRSRRYLRFTFADQAVFAPHG